MKVFITWSGERGKTIAKALHKWLPSVIHNVEPWMSDEDIRAGDRWQSEINQQLEQIDFGIVVLTPDSLSAPWIHYEAGALAKKIEKGAVCPYLVDTERVNVIAPLTQFHSKLATKTETFDLIKAINQRMERVEGKRKLDDAILDEAFEKLFWPHLEEVISNPPTVVPTQAKRSPDDLLTEILERVRSLEQQFVEDLKYVDRFGGNPVAALTHLLRTHRIREISGADLLRALRAANALETAEDSTGPWPKEQHERMATEALSELIRRLGYDKK